MTQPVVSQPTACNPVRLLPWLIGLSVLLLGIAFLALGLPLLLWLVHGSLSLHWLVGGLLLVGCLLWPMLRLSDDFEAPGPALTLEHNPGFRDLLQAVSAAVGVAPPDRIYLSGRVEAWVGHRGGWLGLGGQRVLALGAPLLAGLKQNELAALLAHELAHFHNRDGRYSGWVYRLRQGMGRALDRLQQTGGPLYLPLRALLLRLLRESRAASRQQEFHADATAARLVGAAPAERMLRRLGGLQSAWQGFLDGIYDPVLQTGHAPPLLTGFARFVSDPQISARLDGHDALGLVDTTAHAYASHPSLTERVRALRALNAGPGDSAGLGRAWRSAGGSETALALFDAAILDQSLAGMFDEGFERVEWQEVPRRILLPSWAAQLAELESEALPLFDQLPARLRALRGPAAEASAPLDQASAQAIEMATLLVLLLAGIHSDYAPASGLRLRVRGSDTDPERVLDAIAAGSLPQSQWLRLVERAGLTGLPINQVSRWAQVREHPAPAETAHAQSIRLQRSWGSLLRGPLGWLLLAATFATLAAAWGLRVGMPLWPLALALLLMAATALSILLRPWLPATTLSVDADALELRRGQRILRLPWSALRRVRWRYRDLPGERLWSFAMRSESGHRLRFSHSDHDGRFGAIANPIAAGNLARIQDAHARGEALPIDRRSVLCAEGLQIGEQLLRWDRLLPPRSIDEHISVYCVGRPEPVIELPPGAPDQRALAAVISKRAAAVELPLPFGLRIFAGWTPSLGLLGQCLLGGALGLALFAIARPALWPVCLAWTAISAWPLLRELGRRSIIHERLFVERSPVGSRSMASDQIVAVRCPDWHSLRLEAEDGSRVHIRLPKAREECLDLAQRIASQAVIERMRQEIIDEGRTHWCEGVWLRDGDVADVQTQISLPFDEQLCIERTGDALLLHSSESPEAVIRLPMSAPNLLPGWMLIERVLDAQDEEDIEGDASSASEEAVEPADTNGRRTEPGEVSDAVSGTRPEGEAEDPAAELLAELRQRWAQRAPAGSLASCYVEPDFLAEAPSCPVRRIYADLPLLEADGRVVWGAVVQAHADLFEAENDEPRLAALIYGPGDSDQLHQVAERVYAIKDRLMRLEDVEEQRFADLLADELEQHLRLVVPNSLAQMPAGRLYYTTTVIHPALLPAGKLVEAPLPVLACPRATEAVVILPSHYWPERLRRLWLEQA